ncbi:MAG: DUF6916 family protein [Gammaproteobacteria bacterium]
MLDTLTMEHWAQCLNEPFAIGDRLALRLVSVQPLGCSRPDAHRSAYSLVFLGPMQPLLPQRIYSLCHSRLGTLAIFLVPIGPERDGMRYEAIFT